MYIIRNDTKNAYKTYDGWTIIEAGKDKKPALLGLANVLRFTNNEQAMNVDSLPFGCRWVYFPRRRWKDIPNG